MAQRHLKGPIKLVIAISIALLLAAFFYFDLNEYLSLDAIKAQQGALAEYYADHPAKMLTLFFIIYVFATSLSVPGAALMTLLAGALFGLPIGTILVSFASTLGATFAFLISRFFLRDWVRGRFSKTLDTFDRGIKKEGAFYLFAIRLVPVFPFFVVNLLMGLTSLRTRTFYWVSQVGMLAGTLVYVNAGTQLAQLKSADDLLSPSLWGAFIVLGLFPLCTKKLLSVLNAKRIYRGYRRPKRFEANMVVIGAGAAGLVNAYIAAAVKAKVILIEKHKMGGDCLNYGCVPSKALIRSAKFVEAARQAPQYGIKQARLKFDFADIMQRVKRIVEHIEPHDSRDRYESLGVECIDGEARIISPWQVEVEGRQISTRSIVIAAGATPFIPPIPGLEQVQYYTSDTLWELDKLPPRLLVLGGGPIGCELTQSFARLGSQVTQVEMATQLMMREDPDVADVVMAKFKREGITVLTQHRAKRFLKQGRRQLLVCEYQQQDITLEFDAVLIAVGRRARLTGFGLETLGIDITAEKTVEVNDYLQTNFPNIFAAGDVAGPYQFTHTAAHMAWYTAVNALFGFLKRFKVDYRIIPWATFTDPEVARVGINELEAQAQGIKYEKTIYRLNELDRAIADSATEGFIKVLTEPGRDKILGVSIVGEHAADLIAEYVLAMKQGLGLNKILSTIHIYPTLAEANKYVAGEWKRKHISPYVLRWLTRLHRWRRG